MSKRAVILCGGKGTRLQPYTVVLPKALMPIGDYPILEIVIRQLVKYGFTHITLAVNHQAELIETFFGNGSKWNIKIDYSLEDMPLGTMGPLKLIEDLPEDFLVMNGDVLTDLNFAKFFSEHVSNKNNFTISSYIRDHQIDYGVLTLGDENRLIGFEEKPKNQYHVSMGVYMINKKIIDSIPPAQAYGFDHLMLDLLEKEITVTVKEFKGYWLDIGRHDDYARAIEEFDKNKHLLL